MTCTCPTPKWLAEQEARDAEQRREQRMERRLRKLSNGLLTADTLVRLMAALFSQQEVEVAQ